VTAALAVGDLVQLTDNKGRHHTITLTAGASFHTHKGALEHDDLIGRPEGIVVTSTGGMPYLVLRPILEDFVLSMGRGAAIIYPKDAFAIVGLAGIGPGSHVVEAGAGSGALSCYLLTAVGPTGRVVSHEIRPEFADVARRNVTRWFGAEPDHWSLRVGDLATSPPPEGELADALVLDMLAPWECLDMAAATLHPGGRLIAYVATTTQLSLLTESLRADGRWTEPRATESMVRTWHLEGLAVRPDHRMIAHTAFLLVCRRLADGERLPPRRRRPAPGAYGPDYTGPRPPDVAEVAIPTQDGGEGESAEPSD
jgi:tRNA (adenine57-N1/adenine58-N1)-methyltransferase